VWKVIRFRPANTELRGFEKYSFEISFENYRIYNTHDCAIRIVPLKRSANICIIVYLRFYPRSAILWRGVSYIYRLLSIRVLLPQTVIASKRLNRWSTCMQSSLDLLCYKEVSVCHNKPASLQYFDPNSGLKTSPCTAHRKCCQKSTDDVVCI